MENVTERDSSGVTLEVANIGCYSEVLAYEVTTMSRYQLALKDRASISFELYYDPSVQVRKCGVVHAMVVVPSVQVRKCGCIM